ncbi:MAG: NAD(P)-dependent oxidoreductase [Muribaculaceae bacterium]|nr:NAD(P)-dependent oxidoreductase [Muribaculaceae bacterium]
MEYVCNAQFIPWENLKDKTVFITGATGLIGYTLVQALLYANKTRQLNLKVLALVRDLCRAEERFKDVDNDALEYIIGNVEQLPYIEHPIDYIVHGASQTASKAFVNQPVETILTAIKGTENLLELAKAKNVAGMVYLSSMEVYGFPEKGHKVTEDEIGTLSPLDVRNSYPISKIQCESLCCAYAKEYGIPVMSARLTQTLGPGVNYNDGRVFAEFARCVVEKRDIVLKTTGETERCYLYTADAATAILTILLKGSAGQAYNVANESTYCSIAKMAEKVAAQGGIKVRYDIQPEALNGFPKTLYMYLDTSLLQSLGWKSEGGGIAEMYSRMISEFIKTPFLYK